MSVDKTSSSISAPLKNVSESERFVSAVGAGLLFYSLINGKMALIKAGLASYLLYRSISGNCPLSRGVRKDKLYHSENINIRTSIIVNKPRPEVYAYWRKLENLPLFMNHLKSVVETDQKHSVWTASLPGWPGTICWTSEIVKERLNEFIGWSSLTDADIGNAGKIEFRDAGESKTEIKAFISYRAPLGRAGEQIARLFNFAFEMRIKKELRSFRTHIETLS